MLSIAKERSSRRSANRVLTLVLAAIMGVLAAGSAGAQTVPGGGFDHEGLATQALERHIRPLYADLASKADTLRVVIEQACRSRDAKNGDAIKLAYRDLVLAWSRTEHLRFGPVIDVNRFERVLYWPDRQRIGERQVAQLLSKSDPAALAAEELSKKSVAVQGLTALEVILHGKAGGALLSETPEAKFACGYAGAIATNVWTIAREIVTAWGRDGSFAALWLAPQEQNPVYKSSAGRTVEILKAFRAGIYNARDFKLLPSLGLKRIAIRAQLAPKSRPPFEPSGLALASMIANIEGVLHLYADGGLAERLAVVEPETARLTRVNLEKAIEDMRALEPSGLAVFNEQALMDKLALVRDPLAFALSEGASALAEIAGMGAMVLGFTDDDGD
jgi:uncharacterized protein